MAAINIKAFRGQVPRLSERLLQPNQAKRAMNCKITSGRLDPLGGLWLSETSLAALVRTMWRYRYISGDSTYDNWLVWGTDVDVVQSPTANDTRGSVYFTGDGVPQMTTYATAVTGLGPFPAASFALGAPLPVAKPSVVVTGGSAPTESRSYAFTFTTQFGEESGPSPASDLVTGNISGSWDLSNLGAGPLNTSTISAVANNTPSAGYVRITANAAFSLRSGDSVTFAGVGGMTSLNGTFKVVSVDTASNYVVVAHTTAQTYTSGGTWTRDVPWNLSGMTKRIYRSAGTEAQFLFVDEIPVANTTYSDTKTAAQLGETLPTLLTLPPPVDLFSLISLPNGCLAALSPSEGLCFSDPYMPYSWPIGNRYAFSGRGVALVAAGNSVVVLTDSYPILFTGSDPEAMSPSVMQTYAPCVSKRGVVDVGGGALYPSFDGLWLAAPGRVENLTKKLYREEEWSALRPTSFDAAFYDGKYYGRYVADPDEPDRILVFDVSEPDSVVEVVDDVDALYRNNYDGRLYVSKANEIYEWDADVSNPYISDWTSSTYQLPAPVNFAVAQIHADYNAFLPPDVAQQAINDALVAGGPDAVTGWIAGNELLDVEIAGSYLLPVDTASDRKVQFTLYVDDVPLYTRVVSNSRPFRLPAGYRSEVFNVGLSSSVPVFSVTIAGSVAELAQASA